MGGILQNLHQLIMIQFISMLSSILAIGAYATGSANAGNAILMGGASLGKYNALNFFKKNKKTMQIKLR